MGQDGAPTTSVPDNTQAEGAVSMPVGKPGPGQSLVGGTQQEGRVTPASGPEGGPRHTDLQDTRCMND